MTKQDVCPHLQAAGFVKSRSNRLGSGKLVGVSGGTATVEYFRSIANRFREQLRVESLSIVRLPAQTRCYFVDGEGSWLMGRTGAFFDGEYEVNLPGRQARYVPETSLFVRCGLPIEDPTDVLALKAHETAFFHQHRLEFYRCLVDQRAAFRGMTGLVSSRVELFPHQFDVVRRVLQDPVQRYLLADEVGLGKTVEAGIILRQLLLDQPNATALVLVPPLIIDQWKQELEEKFTFGLAGEVEVYGTNRLLHLCASERSRYLGRGSTGCVFGMGVGQR